MSRAARVLLFDPDNRILLLRGHDPRVAGSAFWYLPGGQIERGETVEAAAAREMIEEIDRPDIEFGGVVAHRRAHFTFNGIPYDHEEWILVGRLPDAVVDVVIADREAAFQTEHAWWALPEVPDGCRPTSIAEIARSVIEGTPHRPFEIDERES